MTEEIFQPIDLGPELALKQRIEDMLLMRKLDDNKFFPIFRYEITDILSELNIRLMQYKQQFEIYSQEFRVFQTLQDFNRYIIQVQSGKKINEEKPVAIMKGSGDKVYFAGSVFVVRKE